MVRLSDFVFGYRKIKIDPCDLSTVSSILLRASVSSGINGDGTITVRERDFNKTKDLLLGRIEFSHSKPMGIYGRLKSLKHKTAIIISLAVSLIIVMHLSGLVWDIRVEGNESLTDSEVVLSLAQCGFQIGDMWSKRNLSEIESAFLNSNQRVAWINLNRRGNVAYVKLIEKEVDHKENISSNSDEPSNIVAKYDCVIEEITVRRGKPVVKVGDTVRKGDLLVIGVLPIESGGEICNADATVIGRINDSLSLEISREYEKSVVKDKKLYSCTINFFKFSLNIFKRYRNLANEYVIIDDEIKYSLLNRCPLPVSISISYLNEYKTESGIYSDEELVNIASDRLSSLTVSVTQSGDLIKIKTYGDFTENGYYMRKDFVYLTDVCERVNMYYEK